MSDPYQEGFEACLLWLEGKHPRYNPYQRGENAVEWDDGWADAAESVAETTHGRFEFRSRDETVAQLVRRRNAAGAGL
ncbi:MAG: hypothetical protein OEQ29_06125 [Alphaproteobacteria bacterium]|nr:hypothetical protein [Alphaproteobacteria bacterium]